MTCFCLDLCRFFSLGRFVRAIPCPDYVHVAKCQSARHFYNRSIPSCCFKCCNRQCQMVDGICIAMIALVGQRIEDRRAVNRLNYINHHRLYRFRRLNCLRRPSCCHRLQMICHRLVCRTWPSSRCNKCRSCNNQTLSVPAWPITTIEIHPFTVVSERNV